MDKLARPDHENGTSQSSFEVPVWPIQCCGESHGAQSVEVGRETVIKKRVASVVAIAVIGAVGLVGGASAHQPVAQVSKYCSAYAEEHFGDRNARTPGGVKCLGPGEYCSHAPGYAHAYKNAGFRCDADGRLEYR